MKVEPTPPPPHSRSPFSLFTLALAMFTKAENRGAIAAASFSVLARAHRLTTITQTPSTAPPESPPPPPPVA
jgi:hypothetical protein